MTDDNVRIVPERPRPETVVRSPNKEYWVCYFMGGGSPQPQIVKFRDNPAGRMSKLRKGDTNCEGPMSADEAKYRRYLINKTGK